MLYVLRSALCFPSSRAAYARPREGRRDPNKGTGLDNMGRPSFVGAIKGTPTHPNDPRLTPEHTSAHLPARNPYNWGSPAHSATPDCAPATMRGVPCASSNPIRAAFRLGTPSCLHPHEHLRSKADMGPARHSHCLRPLGPHRVILLLLPGRDRERHLWHRLPRARLAHQRNCRHQDRLPEH